MSTQSTHEREKRVPIYPPTYLPWLLTYSWIHLEVTDLGRSRGRPRARSQKTWESAPKARETPKSTV